MVWTIRTKILAIILSFLTLVALIFAFYELNASRYYRELRRDGIIAGVRLKAEKANALISGMERNAIDLAAAGQAFYLGGERTRTAAEAVVMTNFRRFPRSIGGGIWFEPYRIEPAALRWCAYACRDEQDRLAVDPSFESPEYDYHTQSWYLTIAGTLAETAPAGRELTAVWSAPYFDATGTRSYMVTVGAGIFDAAGELAGMSTVDWEIGKYMFAELSALKPTPGSFVRLQEPSVPQPLVDTAEPGVSGQMVVSGVVSVTRPEPSGEIASTGVVMAQARSGDRDYLSFSMILKNNMIFQVYIPEAEIFAEIERNTQVFVLVLALSALILLGLTFFAILYFITNPLKVLIRRARELAGGDFEVRFADGRSDEIGLLGSTFNSTLESLRLYIGKLGVETAAKERLAGELEVAARIQTSLLPNTFPPFPGRPEIDIFAQMHTAKEVGGDFYDFFLVDESRMCVMIADVSGKGIPAALFMMISRTILHNNALAGLTVDEILFRTNNALCENNEATMFVTVFLGILDLRTGVFDYCNGGHNPPALLRNGGMEWLPLQPGFVLGALENIHFRPQQTRFEPGDRLFCYTDGVTEAMNPAGELFGEKRLAAVLAAAGDAAPREVSAAVTGAIGEFAKGAEQADDITMLVFRVNLPESQ